jgi:hypothetical protein
MKGRTQRRLRQWHQYLGLFLAPMLLLLAVSGAFQVFRLNSDRGWGGTPPRWVQIIAAIHKNQAMPEAEAPLIIRPASPLASKVAPGAVAHKKPSSLPLQIFVVAASLGLIASTAFGITIALTNRMKRFENLSLLGAGVAVPILLLFF